MSDVLQITLTVVRTNGMPYESSTSKTSLEGKISFNLNMIAM